MKVFFHRRDISNVTVNVNEEIEIDDDASESEIDEQLREWAYQDIDIWWDKQT